MSRIHVVGSMNADRCLYVDHFVRPGETISARSVRPAIGGKGLNQAVAAARLGANVAMVGSVGTDTAGRAILDALADEQVDLAQVRSVTDYATGEAVIQIAAAGDNAIIVVPGANEANLPDDIEARLVHVADGDILVCQLEIPVETVARALAWAKRRGATTVLNVAPAAHVPGLLSDVDLLVVNETEAATLLEAPCEDPAEALFQRFGVDVIVTLGSAGSRVRARAARASVPALPVEVIDTAGAGDAFVGGVVAALAEGGSVSEAARLGAAIAAAACSAPGAQGYPQRRAEVDALAGLSGERV